ncbi:transmembrane protein 220-like isoform X2 [Apostichopus japonicus]
MPHEEPYPGKRYNSPMRLWVMTNVIMGVFFAIAGLSQFRDPAPLMWMLIYFVPSFLCFSIVLTPDVTDKLWWKIVFLVHLICCSIKQVFLGTQLIFWMKDRVINPLKYTEGRQFLGIIIVLVWLLICKCGGNTKGTTTGRTTAVTWCVVALGLFPFTFWIMACMAKFNHCSDMW